MRPSGSWHTMHLSRYATPSLTKSWAAVSVSKLIVHPTGLSELIFDQSRRRQRIIRIQEHGKRIAQVAPK